MRFNVGDRVRYIGSQAADLKAGYEGRVIDVVGLAVSVEFDEYIYGHSCAGMGRGGYCWNVHESNLERVKETKKFESVGGFMSTIKELLKSEKQKNYEKFVLNDEGQINLRSEVVQTTLLKVLEAAGLEEAAKAKAEEVKAEEAKK